MKLKMIFTFLFSLLTVRDNAEPSKVVMNRMAVSWEVKGDVVSFELSSPEHGWLAIGINQDKGLAGTHLIMASVDDNKVEAKDFYIQSAGNYKPFTEIGGDVQVQSADGYEGFSGTTVTFSLPLQRNSKYGTLLEQGQEYTLLMAYSMEDDFKHHSIMRTSTKIKL